MAGGIGVLVTFFCVRAERREEGRKE